MTWMALAAASLLTLPAFAQTEECSATIGQGIGSGPIASIISVTDTGTVTDIDMFVDISGSFASECVVDLQSPTGTVVRTWDGGPGCGSASWTTVTFDDEAGAHQCPPFPASMQPANSLTAFDGEEVNGDWTAIAEDVVIDDGDVFNSWCLTYTIDGGGGGGAAPGASSLTLLVTALLLLVSSAVFMGRLKA